MKTRLQPMLPGRPGVGGVREQPAGRGEKPGAGFQPVTALDAAILVGGNGMGMRPGGQQPAAQTLGAFGDQGGHRRPQPVPIQPAHDPCAESAQPAVHGGGVRMAFAHAPDRLAQAGRRPLCVGIRRTGRFHHRPRVALVGRDLNGQDAQTLLADGADALRHRRLAILDAPTARPARSPRHPSAGPDQRANGATRWTRNLLADRFAFDSRALQGIICDGDGNWDSTLSGSPRGTGVCAPVPHFLQKAETLPLQDPPRKQLVHNRALMSMSFSVFSSEHPEPVRRVLPVSLRCHCQARGDARAREKAALTACRPIQSRGIKRN